MLLTLIIIGAVLVVRFFVGVSGPPDDGPGRELYERRLRDGRR